MNGPSDKPGTQAEPSGAETQDRPYRLRMTIVTALAVGFGLLVFVAASGVLGIGLWSARENTLDLLRDRSELSIDLLIERVRGHLDPVVRANESFAQRIADGEIDPRDDATLASHMQSVLSATPQVTGLAFISADGFVKRFGRRTGRLTRVEIPANAITIRLGLEEARERKHPYWGDLIRAQGIEATLLNRRAPVWRDGNFLGVLVSAISLADLSSYIAETDGDRNGLHSFLLYGRDHVLAHRQMAGGDHARSADLPIPTIYQLGDPVIAHLWDEDKRRPGLVFQSATQGHLLDLPDDTYAIIYRRLVGYASVPITAGAYLALGHGRLGPEFERMVWAGALGMGVVVIALIIAFWMGRRMARPIQELATAADAVRELKLDPPMMLARSRLAELDEAARAFNTMTDGLRWFETYVPRSLVRLLLSSEDTSEAIASATRSVTVMFTDIRGFTTLAENLTAKETASFLNAHFSLLASAVETENGTIDKYIGDSMMAFWGAPEAVPDHAERACRAALAIRDAIAAENIVRRETGKEAVRIGVGIQSGEALVGNIGAPGRVNYTMVGDVVNTAQRIEQLCKEMQRPDEAVTILVGDAVAEQLDGTIAVESCGVRHLRGRGAMEEVFRL